MVFSEFRRGSPLNLCTVCTWGSLELLATCRMRRIRGSCMLAFAACAFPACAFPNAHLQPCPHGMATPLKHTVRHTT
jgi:hypothetical protein